ncbi:tetratricopeptide (TPR) repeat protein [Clostridium acetobutylicum]|uniref:Xre family DNA-binding domain and TPR repeats containing protein n=1 Tax=Clostridium acetobutylicum (strain ATCC 824 / DSM 792 / JCM 1419 / IAM 19013 / LMG 5710 / NBRC 13948 / NRRL B-527 / VKM B-1787 / 2291 / W) TaxID=272562 RepID=Q97G79_CLOAB|nr:MULTISPECIES: transcriptional regulator [Clostridium]AAK80444.1 Xre family DNA-binding domain and TPR repeats containing protein [Clostridium acetobutylicum ATCC 824]ADZ21541.1 Xre family DNA-binding domain and TPR repeats containing protein [Clostridium acetobutylicum EA 2018]AEI32382.1 Xre family DNA-binding domain-/TPR repeat-containing protein [Clostridium acetobutylicum DSM 1731]AWV79139.1 transcriptional regulator [Clostridium acetobutylicum]MBC2394898.1 transcriptional regulator [Clo
MASYEILSVGDKLKSLRKKYKLNQDDLAGNEITRNLISQIEHNKAKLTRKSAEVMMRNLKRICEEREMPFQEDIEYLLEDERLQAEKILDIYINELKDLSVYKDASFVNKLNEAENFLVKWSFEDKKISIYTLAGDYFCNSNDFYKSAVYYEKARSLININMPSHDVVPIFRKLSMVYFYMGKYEYDIKCCEFALDRFEDMDEEYTAIFLYNSALCYTKLKQYDKSLKRLEKIENMLEKGSEKYYRALIHKAVCLQYLEKYDESLDIYNKLLIRFAGKNDYENSVIILLNIAEIYVNLSDNEKALEYLKTAERSIVNLDETHPKVPNIYFELGSRFSQLKDLNNAKEYYLKALEYAKKFKYYFVIEDILLELIDIYNKEKISELKKEFFLVTSKLDQINSRLMLKMIKYYTNISDFQSINEICKFSEDFIKDKL